MKPPTRHDAPPVPASVASDPSIEVAVPFVVRLRRKSSAAVTRPGQPEAQTAQGTEQTPKPPQAQPLFVALALPL